MEPLDFSENPEYEPEFKFFDSSLLEAVRRGDAGVHEFFRLLALCHTVMPDQKNGRLEYQVSAFVWFGVGSQMQQDYPLEFFFVRILMCSLRS